MKRFKSYSPEETFKIAEKFAQEELTGEEIIYLAGELGAGKTLFIKGIAKVFGINPSFFNTL